MKDARRRTHLADGRVNVRADRNDTGRLGRTVDERLPLEAVVKHAEAIVNAEDRTGEVRLSAVGRGAVDVLARRERTNEADALAVRRRTCRPQR